MPLNPSWGRFKPSLGLSGLQFRAALNSQHPLRPSQDTNYNSQHSPAVTSPKLQLPAAFAAGLPHPLFPQHASRPLYRRQTTTPSVPCSPPATQLQLPACPAAPPTNGRREGQGPSDFGEGSGTARGPFWGVGPSPHLGGLRRFWGGGPSLPCSGFWGDLSAILGRGRSAPQRPFWGEVPPQI